VPVAFRYIWSDRHHRGSAQRGRYGLARILTYVTGTAEQEQLARNEYLASETRILKDQLKGRLMPLDAERPTLGEIGHRLGRSSPRSQPSPGRTDPGLVPQAGRP
jgi:hypothetical protein